MRYKKDDPIMRQHWNDMNFLTGTVTLHMTMSQVS